MSSKRFSTEEQMYPPKKRALYEHMRQSELSKYDSVKTEASRVDEGFGKNDFMTLKMKLESSQSEMLCMRPRSDSLHSMHSFLSDPSESAASTSREPSPNFGLFDSRTPERNPDCSFKPGISKPLFPSGEGEGSVLENNEEIVEQSNTTHMDVANDNYRNTERSQSQFQDNTDTITYHISKYPTETSTSSYIRDSNQQLMKSLKINHYKGNKENINSSGTSPNIEYHIQKPVNSSPLGSRKDVDNSNMGPMVSLLSRFNKEAVMAQFSTQNTEPHTKQGKENGKGKNAGQNMGNSTSRQSNGSPLDLLLSGNTKSYKCRICNKEFEIYEELKSHMKVEHSGPQPYKCVHCPRAFSQYNNLQRHLRVHRAKIYKCNLCDREFNEEFYLNMHMGTHTGKRLYSCGVCSASFTSNQDLKLHVKTHTPSQLHTCEVCGKSFSKACVLRQHRKGHTGERPHKCEKCPKTFIHRHHLTMHMRSHSGDRQYFCDVCKKEFYQSSHLYKHLKGHEEKGEITRETIDKMGLDMDSTDKALGKPAAGANVNNHVKVTLPRQAPLTYPQSANVKESASNSVPADKSLHRLNGSGSSFVRNNVEGPKQSQTQKLPSLSEAFVLRGSTSSLSSPYQISHQRMPSTMTYSHPSMMSSQLNGQLNSQLNNQLSSQLASQLRHSSPHSSNHLPLTNHHSFPPSDNHASLTKMVNHQLGSGPQVSNVIPNWYPAYNAQLQAYYHNLYMMRYQSQVTGNQPWRYGNQPVTMNTPSKTGDIPLRLQQTAEIKGKKGELEASLLRKSPVENSSSLKEMPKKAETEQIGKDNGSVENSEKEIEAESADVCNRSEVAAELIKMSEGLSMSGIDECKDRVVKGTEGVAMAGIDQYKDRAVKGTEGLAMAGIDQYKDRAVKGTEGLAMAGIDQCKDRAVKVTDIKGEDNKDNGSVDSYRLNQDKSVSFTRTVQDIISKAASKSIVPGTSVTCYKSPGPMTRHSDSSETSSKFSSASRIVPEFSTPSSTTFTKLAESVNRSSSSSASSDFELSMPSKSSTFTKLADSVDRAPISRGSTNIGPYQGTYYSTLGMHKPYTIDSNSLYATGSPYYDLGQQYYTYPYVNYHQPSTMSIGHYMSKSPMLSSSNGVHQGTSSKMSESPKKRHYSSQDAYVIKKPLDKQSRWLSTNRQRHLSETSQVLNGSATKFSRTNADGNNIHADIIHVGRSEDSIVEKSDDITCPAVYKHDNDNRTGSVTHSEKMNLITESKMWESEHVALQAQETVNRLERGTGYHLDENLNMHRYNSEVEKVKTENSFGLQEGNESMVIDEEMAKNANISDQTLDVRGEEDKYDRVQMQRNTNEFEKDLSQCFTISDENCLGKEDYVKNSRNSRRTVQTINIMNDSLEEKTLEIDLDISEDKIEINSGNDNSDSKVDDYNESEVKVNNFEEIRMKKQDDADNDVVNNVDDCENDSARIKTDKIVHVNIEENKSESDVNSMNDVKVMNGEEMITGDIPDTCDSIGALDLSVKEVPESDKKVEHELNETSVDTSDITNDNDNRRVQRMTELDKIVENVPNKPSVVISGVTNDNIADWRDQKRTESDKKVEHELIGLNKSSVDIGGITTDIAVGKDVKFEHEINKFNVDNSVDRDNLADRRLNVELAMDLTIGNQQVNSISANGEVKGKRLFGHNHLGVNNVNRTSQPVDADLNNVCGICWARFDNSSDFENHQIEHAQRLEASNKCHYCSKEFSRSFDLQCHLLKHRQYGLGTSQNENSVLMGRKSVENGNQGRKGGNCGKENMNMSEEFGYLHDNSSNQSVNVLSNRGESESQAGVKLFRCDICSRRFTHQHNLNRHKMSHNEKSYECSHCNRTFKEKFYLQMHQKTHAEEKTRPCEICGKLVPKSDLWRHTNEHLGNIIGNPTYEQIGGRVDEILKRKSVERNVISNSPNGVDENENLKEKNVDRNVATDSVNRKVLEKKSVQSKTSKESLSSDNTDRNGNTNSLKRRVLGEKKLNQNSPSSSRNLSSHSRKKPKLNSGSENTENVYRHMFQNYITEENMKTNYNSREDVFKQKNVDSSLDSFSKGRQIANFDLY